MCEEPKVLKRFSTESAQRRIRYTLQASQQELIANVRLIYQSKKMDQLEKHTEDLMTRSRQYLKVSRKN